MAEWLKINVCNDKEVLASAYYANGACTETALIFTEEIVNAYGRIREKTSNNLKLAVDILQATGAGIIESEYDAIMSDARFCGIHFKNMDSVFYGMIIVSEEGLANPKIEAIGEVSINIEREVFIFSVYDEYEIEEFESEFGDEAVDALFRRTSNQFPVEILFEKFADFKDLISNTPDGFLIDNCTVLRPVE